MKRSCLIILGTMLIAGPAGAATLASTEGQAMQRKDVLAPPMRVTELFTIPAVERVLHPTRFAEAEHEASREQLAGYTRTIRQAGSNDQPVGYDMTTYSDLRLARQ